MEEVIEQYNEHKTPMSLLILDIDFFKRVNDTYGHPVGDKVLVHLAQLMKGVARGQDHLCRYGGEEFVVILPNTPIDLAREIGTAYNKAVAKESWPEIGTLTISVGIATIQDDDTEAQLLNRADRALYYSKQNGRNRVTHVNDI